jgi:Tol biopolymer transport system component
LYSQAADGSDRAAPLVEGRLPQTGTWSPDGKVFAFIQESATGKGSTVFSLTPGPPRQLRPVVESASGKTWAELSPDGRWLAYVSDEAGQQDVYVQSFPDGGAKVPISTGGGTRPRWSRDRRELFYRNGGKVMAVSITTTPTFSAGPARLLFSGPYGGYDVAPDGRFVMVQQDERADAGATQIALVHNWFEELKRRVPVR